ncbi:MAG: hypothetical protein RIQ60_4148 [Pseudomonadota bacterium]|jgi:uncharacterized protein YbjT (DUF2867 family)
MNVLLTGASGFLGRNITQILTARGHLVRPISRRQGIDMCRLLAPADWQPHLAGIDAVINAAGIIGESRRQRFDALHRRAPIALFQACERAGIRRVVQISALGADETAVSPYHLSKRAADTALRQLDLDGIVLRPALIYGRGGTSAAMFMRLASLPLIPVLEGGDQKIQPVHVSDVVDIVARAVCPVSPPIPMKLPMKSPLDIAGPQTLAFTDWLQALRAAQGLPPGRFVHLPRHLAMGMFYLARPFHPMASPDNLRMLSQGMCADSRDAEGFLGRALLHPQTRLQFEDASILQGQP